MDERKEKLQAVTENEQLTAATEAASGAVEAAGSAKEAVDGAKDKAAEMLGALEDSKWAKWLKPGKPTLGDYWKIGRRYVSKRLVIVLSALLALLLIAAVLIVFVFPPPAVDQWLGRCTKLTEGTEKAQSFSGCGRIFDDNGTLRYQGKLVEGKKEGEGKLYKPNGHLAYEGDFKEDHESGHGAQYDDNGNLVYEGAFADDAYEGAGVLYYPGRIKHFEGTFTNGKLSGDGVEYYQLPNDQIKYKGTFLEGVYDGKGVALTDKGAKVYEGEYAVGVYNGHGVLFKDGKKSYEGDFRNGVFAGKGQEFYPNGAVRYDGTFANGLYHGEGTLTTEDNAVIYTGGFAKGLYSGQGELHDSKGVYKGEFLAGKRSGIGQQTNPRELVVYKGFWKDDKPYYQGFLGLPKDKVQEILASKDDKKEDGGATAKPADGASDASSSPTSKPDNLCDATLHPDILCYKNLGLTFHFGLHKGNPVPDQPVVISVEVGPSPSGSSGSNPLTDFQTTLDPTSKNDGDTATKGTTSTRQTHYTPSQVGGHEYQVTYEQGDILITCWYNVEDKSLTHAMFAYKTP